jgi:hypothetical protein
VAGGSCSDTSDCGLGESCVDGRCGRSDASCDTDDDCDGGTCEDGACVG